MKGTSKLLLLVTGFVAVFAFSAYFVFLPQFTKTEYSSLRELKADLGNYLKSKDSKAPFLEIENFWPNQEELTKPANFLPHYDHYNLDEIQALYEFSLSCKEKAKYSNYSKLKKAWLWQLFICKWSKLPADFFTTPPFVHPSGQSYSYLAAKENIEAPKNLRTWLEVVQSEPQLNKYFGPEDWVHFTSLEKQTDFIFLENYVLVKKEFGNFNYRYFAYPRVYVDEYFSQAKPYTFILSSQIDKNLTCIENLERGCWALNAQYESGKKRALNFAMLAAMTISAILFLVLAAGVIKEKNDIRNDRNFIMRTLTHELRTPIAALSLEMESLRKLFNSVDEDSQKSLLRVFNSVERLKSLVQGSEKYLSADAGTIRKNNLKEKINLNSCVIQIVDSQNLDVQILVPEDLVVTGNEYWAKLCLQNLIQNALLHGKKPVIVSGYREDNEVYLDVIDQGKILGELSTLAKPFSKDSNSKGLGLGLEIAQKSAKLSFAELKLVKTPNTIFRLVWRA